MRASPFISLKNSFSESASLYSPCPLAAHCCRRCACIQRKRWCSMDVNESSRLHTGQQYLLPSPGFSTTQQAVPVRQAGLCVGSDLGFELAQALLAQGLQVVLLQGLHGLALKVQCSTQQAVPVRQAGLCVVSDLGFELAQALLAQALQVVLVQGRHGLALKVQCSTQQAVPVRQAGL